MNPGSINMKTFLSALLVLATLAACNGNKRDGMLDPNLVNNPASANGKAKGDLPEMKFDYTVHDFGNIKSGDKVRFSFGFTNTGKSDLIIGDARGSCGCTVPNFPTEPIAPGDTGSIQVVFNSRGKSGVQNKSITVLTNCEPATKVLTIKANVKPTE
jgi:hypothetical protein